MIWMRTREDFIMGLFQSVHFIGFAGGCIKVPLEMMTAFFSFQATEI